MTTKETSYEANKKNTNNHPPIARVIEKNGEKLIKFSFLDPENYLETSLFISFENGNYDIKEVMVDGEVVPNG